MTTAEIYTMIQAVGVPCVYHHFKEGTGKQPPFICFYFDGDNDLLADDSNYVQINRLIIELYTDAKEFDLEQTLESVLKQNGFVWTTTETYIESEKMYMETYSTEVLINGE